MGFKVNLDHSDFNSINSESVRKHHTLKADSITIIKKILKAISGVYMFHMLYGKWWEGRS